MAGWTPFQLPGSASTLNWGIFLDPFGNRWLTDSLGSLGQEIPYQPNTNSAAQSPPVILANIVGPLLLFQTWFSLEPGFDFLFVEVSSDGGTSWMPIAGYTGESGGLCPVCGTPAGGIGVADLSQFEGRTIQLRFQLRSDGSVNSFGAFVDNVGIAKVDGTQYEFSDGTSFSAPIVSGVAALLMAQRPDLSHRQIRDIIVNSVTKAADLEGKVSSGGRVNALAALEAAIALPKVPSGEIISYVPAAAAPAGYVSFVRVANRGTAATPVSVELVDETTGQVTTAGPLVASLAPQAAVTFDAFAIESAMGVSLPAAQRPRLRLLGSTSLEFQSYMSNPGGIVTNLTSSDTGLSVDVASYIPAAVSASGYTSFVRIANTGGAATPVTVSVLDGSTGAASTPRTVIASLAPGAARTLSSAALEAALGTSLPGNARPRLRVSGSAQLEVQSYMSNPGGVVTNLSTTQSGNTVDVISYVPAAVSASGYTSFVRVANTGVSPTAVSVALVQESGTVTPAQTLIASLTPGAAITLSAPQIESALGVSLPAGDRPRIRLTAAQPLQVQSYMANPGGVVSNLTNLVTGTTLEVISYVPAAVSASGYTSFVRVANKGSSSTSVRGSVINDDGSVGLTGTLISALAPRASVTLSSAQIEAALGTFLPAASRPRLRIQSAVELEVQSYMSNPGGVVENLTDARLGP